MRVYARVDLDAIRRNMDSMHHNLLPGTKMAAVIKADGYGHGAAAIAEKLESLDYLWGYCAATYEEAKQLREKWIRKPVLILGYVFPYCYESLVKLQIRPVVFRRDMLAQLNGAAGRVGEKLNIHIAVDTGMSRIGFRDNDASVAEIVKIAKLPNIEIEGLFTHFARADEVSIDPAVRQLERYDAFAEKVQKAGVDIPIHHVSNSAGIIRLREANKDMVRAGITVYGLMPSADVETDIVPLKPVMSLVSHISYVKNIEAGDEVSYGGTFKAEKTMRVATIPVGYADGYPRMLSGKGHVLIKGRKAPILGRVCMDQFMVDVTDIEGATRGDEVVLLGKQGDERITAEELGDISGRFNYELVCDISKRVPRNFIYEGRIIEQSECI